jgi:hypothetical protein
MTRRATPLVILAGAIAQRPKVGGHAWVFLNWLLGLRSIGCDVLFIDVLEPEMLPIGADRVDRSPQWSWLCSVMIGAGLEGCFALLFDGGRQVLGMTRQEVLERCRRADVLFNFMGYLQDEELFEAPANRVFVDIDPGFPQMWSALGLHDPFVGHDTFVTVGLGVGSPASTVPTCGRRWLPTPPPVDLTAWPMIPLPRGKNKRITSVATWRGPFAPIHYEGVNYGLRAHEQRAFFDLPRHLNGIMCELALDIEPDDAQDADGLRSGGWRLVDPRSVADTIERYRHYLQGSTAELIIAKSMYVRSRGGWFSDRSACYLATGCPVVAQDTGFRDYLPVGEGLLLFSNLNDAVAGIAEVTGDLSRHSRKAREIAVDCLDARKVLRSVLMRSGVM